MENKNKIRLNKAIAMSGITSRRKADELIISGKVKVNGKVVSNLGYKVTQSDNISVNGRVIKPEKHKYILLYKPRGYITTTKDEFGRKIIYELLGDKYNYLKPVGRLDRDSEGLLFLTNDGYLANQIMHPNNKIKKTYLVSISGLLLAEEVNFLIRNLLCGVSLSKEIHKVDSIRQVLIASGSQMKQTVFEAVIHEGINRQIRRMFQVLGYAVSKLKRIKIGPFELGNLQKGKYLELTKEKAYAILQSSTKQARATESRFKDPYSTR